MRNGVGTIMDGTSWAALLMTLLTASAARADRVYVDKNTSGGNTGVDWPNAYQELQTALADGDATEIWVADGTYKPTTGSDRDATFQLRSGVAVYGGFAGGETSLGQRDWKTNIAILSGEINTGSISDNSYHVVLGEGADATAILDGFTITGGNASESSGQKGAGGGFASCLEIDPTTVCDSGDREATIRNCVFHHNYAMRSGAAMQLRGDSEVSNCVFYDNVTAGASESHSGAIHVCCNSGAGPEIIDCVFYDNHADRWGGAVSVGESNAIFINCLFFENTTTAAQGDGGGGAMYIDSTGEDTAIINCTFADNSALDENDNGGGLLVEESPDVLIINSIFWDNDDDGSSGTNAESEQIHDAGENVTVTYSDIHGCDDENGFCEGSGHHNINADPLFKDGGSGDYRLETTSPALDVGNDGANASATDLLGRPRKRGKGHAGPGVKIIDLGPYEVGGTAHVDKDATAGAKDGTGWTNAYTDLQDALAEASQYEELSNIYVADGTYKPTGGGDRAAAFELAGGAAVEGGYAGMISVGPVDPNTHNVSLYETILSGDIDGSGNADSYHVVTAAPDLIAGAGLNGVTVKKGHADGSGSQSKGGGLYVEGEANGNTPLILDCTIIDNYAVCGGGAYVEAAPMPLFYSTHFADNEAEYGGAMYFHEVGDPLIRDCTFAGNEAIAGAGLGGAVYISIPSGARDTNPNFVRCEFRSNEAKNRGGAVFVDGPGGGGETGEGAAGAPPAFENCLFYSNEAMDNSASKGGAIYNERAIALTNCTLAKNKTDVDDMGGGVYNWAGSSTIINCILWKNKCDGNYDDEPDQIVVVSGSLTVTNCCIMELSTWGGNDNVDTDPLFTSEVDEHFWLVTTGCSGGLCQSEAIDESNNSIVNCSDGDIRLFNRCVELEGHGAIADMGCYESEDE